MYVYMYAYIISRSVYNLCTHISSLSELVLFRPHSICLLLQRQVLSGGGKGVRRKGGEEGGGRREEGGGSWG